MGRLTRDANHRTLVRIHLRFDVSNFSMHVVWRRILLGINYS